MSSLTDITDKAYDSLGATEIGKESSACFIAVANGRIHGLLLAAIVENLGRIADALEGEK